MAELPSLVWRWAWGLATEVQGIFEHTYTGAAVATFWDLTSQLWYFVVVGALVTAGMLAFNGFVVPRSTAVVHAFQNEYYREAPESPGGAEVYRLALPR